MKLDRVNISFRDIILLASISVILTLFSIVLHIGNKDSMLFVDQLDSTLTVHKTDLAFKKRLLTTELIELIAYWFNMRTALAFVVVNYGLTILNGIILGCLSLHISKSVKVAIFSLLTFYLSFPILFAYFHPVYTFDEPLQFAFLLSGALFWLKERKILSIILLLLAVITRETALLLVFFYPFIFNFNERSRNKKTVEGLILFGVLTGSYLVYSLSIESAFVEDLQRRVNAFATNFGTTDRAIESLTSLFLVIGFPLTLLATDNIRSERLRHPILLAILVNTSIVVFTANARESRLFFLPLLLLAPFLGELIQSYFSKTWKYMIKRMSMTLLTVLFIYIGFCFWFTSNVYDSTIGNSGGGLFKIYLFINAMILFPGFILFLKRVRMFKETHQSFNKN